MQTAKTDGRIANDRPLSTSISKGSFVHLTLLLLVLFGAATLNEISLIIPRSTKSRKNTVFCRYAVAFFRNNKGASQIPLKINNETDLQCLLTIVVQVQ